MVDPLTAVAAATKAYAGVRALWPVRVSKTRSK